MKPSQPIIIEDNEIDSIDDCVDGVEEPLYGFRHSIYIRTVSCKHLLSTLLNWFKPAYGPFGQSNMHRTLNSWSDQPGRNQMYKS